MDVQCRGIKQGDRPLAGYTIERGVGRGGFGEVYYARSDGGKDVALKFLRENPQIELRGVSHCLNLKSPYLVSIHDVRQNDEGDYFVIMEYVNGPSLRDLMNDGPSGLGPQKAAFLLREIAKGLAYLHDRGIVHRDLKPGNIFLARSAGAGEPFTAKLLDFGLAKAMAPAIAVGGETMMPAVTAQGAILGTFQYMAPEQLHRRTDQIDERTDVFGLGGVLFEIATEQHPAGFAVINGVKIAAVPYRGYSIARSTECRLILQLFLVCWYAKRNMVNRACAKHGFVGQILRLDGAMQEPLQLQPFVTLRINCWRKNLLPLTRRNSTISRYSDRLYA